ncbi:uncharacterized protein LOC134830049 [Culicoides brevitarsis]|uniref:uncharacterized protein LOC134830049 n=1 Tax=Culicoides brevitarsis TaxID=469753 RepID=UPI00307C5541
MFGKINIIILTLLWISNSYTSGTQVYTPLSQIGISIPNAPDTLAILRGIPLTKLHVEQYIDTNHIHYFYYEIEPGNTGALRIDKKTGELWIGPNFTAVEDTTTILINVKSDLKVVLARISVTLTPIEPANVEEFCDKYTSKLCFFDSVLYNIPENNRLMEEVGVLGPTAYKKICPQATIEYAMMNGTDYFTVINDTLITKNALDHENFNPGPEITIKVQCNVQSHAKSTIHTHFHTFAVNILDLNDNGPVEQVPDKIFEAKVEFSQFRKDDELKHDSIIFLDADSLPVNYNMRFYMENDTLHALRPLCTPYEHDSDSNGPKQTVYNCKIVFDKFGLIPSFPYCVALKAFDTKIISSVSPLARSKICLVSSNKTKSRLDNELPRAEPLKALRMTETDGSSSIEIDEIYPSRPKKNKVKRGAERISYPKNVTLYKSATNFSRVVQPINLTDFAKSDFKLNFGFKLTSNGIEGLNITKNGGIVYVWSPEKIRNTLKGIYQITISWQNYSTNVDLHLQEGNRSKKDQLELMSCAEMYDEHLCVTQVSYGTPNGHCQWRAPINSSKLSRVYGTCSTDLEHCPNNYCDPLEALGERLNHDICPQDCSKIAYHGGFINKDTGQGITSGSGICTCQVGKCSCMPLSAWEKSAATTSEPFAAGTKQRIVEEKKREAHYGDHVWMIVASAVFFVIFLLIYAMFAVRNKSYKRKLKEQELMHIEKLKNEPRIINIEIPLSSTEDGKIKYNFDAKWEVKRENIILEDTIGEGEFGKVFRGQALHLPFTSTVNTTVAVKMLKTGANNFELLALMSEYEMLQDLSHPNVIKLLGACTTAETPLLIIEYCHFGSLKNFLRMSRKAGTQNEYINQVEPITEKDVLSFAWQISKGMSYLADMKLVHRDLAARNVLVTEGKICKISDFGLTRDIYEDDAYLKKSKDRVPVKWMAPESLSDQVYTIKSDVWAYAVLCWEIITLGACPYAAVPLQNLYSLLISGYRMPRPNNCSEEIYSIIQSCWVIEPQKRPTFDSLMKKWEELLTRGAKYLEMSIPESPLKTVDDDDGKITETSEVPSEDSSTETDVMLRNPEPSAPIEDPSLCEPLWTPPLFDSPEIKGIDNRRYFGDNVTIKSWQAGYDFPKPFGEPKTKETGCKRYENEPPKKLSWSRLSHPDLKSELNKANCYDVPINSNKRVQSYLEMDKLDQHVQNNLKNEEKAQKLSKNLDGISFTFVSN